MSIIIWFLVIIIFVNIHDFSVPFIIFGVCLVLYGFYLAFKEEWNKAEEHQKWLKEHEQKQNKGE